MLAVALVGSVDHGKSTLLGRLLYELGRVPARRVEQLQESSRRRGVPLEWSFLLDSFQAERGQAVTLDVTQVRIEHAGRELTFIDAPGHVEFLRNLVSGAAHADAAVLMIEAILSAREQTLRHSALLRLLGVRDVMIAINKIDLCPEPEGAFTATADWIEPHLTALGLTVRAIIPVNARDGVNLVARSDATPWYGGPALLEALHAIEPRRDAATRALRLPIQDVYRIDDTRLAVGRIESGAIAEGDEIVLSPSGTLPSPSIATCTPSAARGSAIAAMRRN